MQLLQQKQISKIATIYIAVVRQLRRIRQYCATFNIALIYPSTFRLQQQIKLFFNLSKQICANHNFHKEKCQLIWVSYECEIFKILQFATLAASYFFEMVVVIGTKLSLESTGTLLHF